MKSINKTNQRKKIMLVSLFFVLLFLFTFSLTYGQRNDPTIIFIDDKLNGIVGSVVHVNDLNADYYYYKGMNYTSSSSGTLPTMDDKNIHPDNRLVEVELTYSGLDANNNLRGYVSLGELQDTFIYYKVFPVNDNGTSSNTSDDYILIELIENPFTNRPNDKGFNGWVTDFNGAELSFDKVYYTRYAKVPVSYSSGMPSKVEIEFSASWIDAKVSFVSGTSSTSWTNGFNNLNNGVMQSIEVANEEILPLDMSGYFKEITVAFGQSTIGYYDSFGNIVKSPTDPDMCNSWEVPVGAVAYDENGVMQVTEANSDTICYKEGMIVFKEAKNYGNVLTSGGQFDVLVVAGGGSGARSAGSSAGGGGGGAGGLILRTDHYLAPGNQAINVGLGGIANPSNGDNDGRSGENTVAFSLTAIGGGGGGARSSTGLNGGSGGGGGSRGGTGGNGTTNQGNNGGDGDPVGNGQNGAGGGGGFSQAGTNGIMNDKGGDGGNGYNGSSIFGTAVGESGWFSGGGGGGISGSNTAGAPGLGGGGLGGVGNTEGQNAIDNTGGGGGGSPRSGYGAGDGGSGVVIVRWDEAMQVSPTCQTAGGCTYYQIISNEYYVEGNNYYEVTGGAIQLVDNGTLPFQYGNVYEPGFDDDSVMAGYFRLELIPRYSSVEGYYDVNGIVQSGTCNSSGGCSLYELIQYRDGAVINSPNSVDEYYYLATRDTNIVVINANTSSTWGTGDTKPFTLTSVHNNNDYRGSALWNTSRVVRAYNDTNIENMRISTVENVNNTTPASNTTTSRVFYGNWQNVRFGRGITRDGSRTTFRTVIGGSNGSTGNSSNITKYKLIIESGFYSTTSLTNGANSSSSIYVENKTIYGNDFDRVVSNNDRLIVNFVASGSWGGNLYSSSSITPILDLTVKSGRFGDGKSDHTTGIYVGGRQGGTHNAPRVAKIEGGWTYNLIGGPLTASNRGDLNDSYIYMTGGEVDVIVGGAGTSATYGHRIVQVTGGKVNYNVFGGSNGYNGSGSDGTLRGSSYMYIGGIATIGDATLVANDSSLWGAEAGSVFGIGNGRSGYSSIGSSDNSNIIVTDDAVINKNVYGGGNYGATGISSGSSTTYSNLTMYGGTIKGDLYGGGNNNGAGDGSVTATININVEDGIVEGAIYGGSNTLGSIYGDTNLNIIGGDLNNIYGGGRGGYVNSTNYGTYVRNNVNVTIGDSSGGPTVTGDIYGGSAFGSVNKLDQSLTESSDQVTVIINNGDMQSDVFGGGQGNASFGPHVAGRIEVTVNGGDINNVFGGNDLNGLTFKNSFVTLNGGTANSVFGGGNQVASNLTTVTLDGSAVNNIYGGSNLSGDVIQSNITTLSGTANNIYGGNNIGGKTSTTDINIEGGIIGSVYGGGSQADVDNTFIDLISGTVTSVFGGGAEASVIGKTTVNLSGASITNIYGGSNLSGNIPISDISLNSGTVTNVYGGNNVGGKTTTTNIMINDGTIGSVYGGGKQADVDTTNIISIGGNTTNIFGGGADANVLLSSNVSLLGGTIGSIYGGSNLSGDVEESIITLSGGSATDVYGGNNVGGKTLVTNILSNNTIVLPGLPDTPNIQYINNPIDPSLTACDIDGMAFTHILDKRDSTTYPVTKIGNQCWVASNITYTGNGCLSNSWYSGSACATHTTSYGTEVTYQWDALMDGDTAESSQGICPDGWYLPSDSEWSQMEMAIGMSSGDANSTGWRGSNEGAKIKSSIDWNGTNEFGFNALASGYVSSGGGSATGIGSFGLWWTSSVSGSSSWARYVHDSISTIYRGTLSSSFGFGARCIQGVLDYDNEPIEGPGATITTIYGGGKQATSDITNVNLIGGDVTNVYGGGAEADVTVSTNVTINGVDPTNVYGGSNLSGTIPTSNILLQDGVVSNIYGGNNIGGTTTNTIVNLNGGMVTRVFGGGNQADVTTSNVTVNMNSNSVGSLYGGGNQADVTTSNVNVQSGIIGSVYGGSNQTGAVTTSLINVENATVGDLFGGNNQGGTTLNTTISIDSAIIGNVYGGGNTANILNNTAVDIQDSDITGLIFGGGNNAPVLGNSFVRINNTRVGDSAYAGGNGVSAVVHGDTTLYIEGTSEIDNHVFGGGNAANTGLIGPNNSTGKLVISGGTIGGNVYGGANTAVLYGTANLYIGYGYSEETLIESDINIVGTVFGGGEANASGDENYDFSFISVTTGIDMQIIGDPARNLTIGESIFGSGNASSTTGLSIINIENYGTLNNPKRNVSIQRASVLTINNSNIELLGATDRTNEYSSTLFSLSRIKHLKQKNNSILYLETGTNLLEKISSLVDSGSTEVKASVTIDEDGDYVRNVNNRIYMLEGKNMNVATNEAVTAYGEVLGMTFFGMYTRDRDDNIDAAYFSPNYDFGDTVEVGEFYHFSSGSYVLGRHALNHDINIDGFYTYEENPEDLNTIKASYIVPIPEDANYYMWIVGESIASYDIELTASKFTTLGAYELSLLNFTEPNTKFTVVGANFNELDSNFQLVRKNQIPRISPDGTADDKMSLVMQTSNTGWITVGETLFLTEEPNPLLGTIDYVGENSTLVPSLLFYLYHSKNLESSGDIGVVTISLLAATPIDDLNFEVERININVSLNRVLYTANDYEGAMTPGEEHNIFVSTLTDVTVDSKITAYYSLFVETSTPFFATGDYRSFVSSYVLPEKTKLTMIDLASGIPIYYYYVVSAADVITAQNEFALHNEASYPFSRFTKMGSTSLTNNFNDAVQNDIYYNSSTGQVSEEFVVITDFGESNIQSNKNDETLLIELRGSQNQTKMTVLGIQHADLTYNLYANNSATIDLDQSLSKTEIYMGEKVNIDLNMDFVQSVINSRVVQDTTFYGKRMGIKINIIDQNDNVLSSGSLFGLRLRYNGVYYYPQFDGSFRINVAPRVANVFSRIELQTQNANIPSGLYKVRTEVFASADGIYFGDDITYMEEDNLTIRNNAFGLKVNLNDRAVIIDKETGNTNLGNNVIIANTEFSSALANPVIRINMKRRNYDDIYSDVYDNVDFTNYFSNSLTRVGLTEDEQFILYTNPLASQDHFLYLKNNLMSGTYQLSFQVYDGNNFIGEVYKYVIIK